MSSKQDIPLIIEPKDNTEPDGVGLEIMLTTLEGKNTTKPNYDSIREVLLPGDELMTRDEVPWYPWYLYLIYYMYMAGTPFILSYLSYVYMDDPNIEEYIAGMIILGGMSLILGWFIGAIFYNLCGMPSNYTRKIGHLYGFVFPLLFAGGVGALEEGGGFNTDQAYENIIFDVVWAAWSSQIIILLMAKPSRACSNYLCGNTRSKNPCRWINCCENTQDAFERKEDRPNHLLWLNTQFVLYFFFLFCLSFWWQELDSGVFVLIPAFISGLGDGLAEPVGVKFGKNGCYTGKDCTYKTHGCCTKYDYVRSIPGSAMVLLSGYFGVGFAYGSYSTLQFIIAMIIVPPIGAIVEAKAPHTMDNPFIALIIGVVSTSILYIEFE